MEKTPALRMFRSVLIILLSVISLGGCSSSDDCGACFTPPASFVFDLIDKESGQNIFRSESYTPEQVTVWNLTEDKKEPFWFIVEDQLYWISIQTIGWETEKVDYEIRLDGEVIADLYVDAERKTVDCCTFTKYNEVRLENAEYEYDDSLGIYKIFLD